MIIILYIAIIAVIPVIAAFLNFYTQLWTQSGDVTVIPYILDLTYSENRGVAFGWFQNGTVFFAITTSIVILVFIILLFKNYKKSKLFSIASALIIGGGAANLFERVSFGYVVDYLKLSFFPPICNFADYCITAGTVCLIVYLLFYSDLMKEDKNSKKKKELSSVDSEEESEAKEEPREELPQEPAEDNPAPEKINEDETA